MTGAQALRQLLATPGGFVIPGAANALTAKIAQEVGFRAVLFTGAGFANFELGVPDLGLTTMTEVVQQVSRITDVVDIPVIADADTGYGNALNVRRTVRELERAGAAAILLEDQVGPKRCGHFDGKNVIPAEEMITKLKAALDTRRDPAVVIWARTDARATRGIDEAIERAQAYAAAGADATFVEAPLSEEELVRIPRSIPVPQMANVIEGGKTPVFPAAVLAAMGYKLIVNANAALRAAVKGMQTVLTALARDGGVQTVLDHMVTWEERQRVVGLPAFKEMEMRYAVPAPVVR
jgi:2-methylisocitrate lyase-like PEP mutase family enzyme